MAEPYFQKFEIDRSFVIADRSVVAVVADETLQALAKPALNKKQLDLTHQINSEPLLLHYHIHWHL